MTETVFSSDIIRYTISAIILFSMIVGINKIRVAKGIIVNKVGFLWLPYILYTIIGWSISLSINSMVYWIIAFLFVTMLSSISFEDLFPVKLIAIFGLIAFSGIIFQMLFGSLYYGKYISIFNQISISDIKAWSAHTGYAGFTYQLGMNAAIMICGEGCFLYFCYCEKYKEKRRYNIVACVICIIGVFLTGKRTASIISLLCPVLISILAQKSNRNRIVYELLVVLFLTISYFVLINNVQSLLDTRALGRIANSLLSIRSGDDFSSGRNQLYQSALDVFRQYPLFGIGIGKYTTFTGQGTGVHNTYLQVLCEQGLVGFVLFTYPLIYSLIKTITLLKAELFSSLRPFLCVSIFFQIYFIIYSFTGNTNSDLFGFIMYFSGVTLYLRCRKLSSFGSNKIHSK